MVYISRLALIVGVLLPSLGFSASDWYRINFTNTGTETGKVSVYHSRGPYTENTVQGPYTVSGGGSALGSIQYVYDYETPPSAYVEAWKVETDSPYAKILLLDSVTISYGSADAQFELSGDLGAVPTTWYTNSVTMTNNTIGLLGVDLVFDDFGGDGVQVEKLVLQPGEDFTAEVVGTNGTPSVTLQPYPFGGNFQESPYPAVQGTNASQGVEFTPPAPNQNESIIWSGGGMAGDARDATLKEGFDTLYNAVSELAAREENRELNVTNNVSVTNQLTMDFPTNIATESTLRGMSNILAADGVTAFSNAVPTASMTGENLLTAAGTAVSDGTDAIEEAEGFFANAFGVYTSPTAPDMTVTVDNGLYGFSMNLDPASNTTIQSMASGFRAALQWIATLIFVIWAVNYCLKRTQSVVKSPQLGTPKLGGGALGFSVGNIGWIFGTTYLLAIGVVLTGMLLLIATFGETYATYISNMVTDWCSASNFTAIGLYLFDMWIPWPYFMTLCTAAVAWWVLVNVAAITGMMAVKMLLK